MSPLTARDNDSVCEVREQFVELISTAIDLMRAEFDAIIKGTWGGGSAPPQPSQAQLTPGPRPSGRGRGPGHHSARLQHRVTPSARHRCATDLD